MRERETEREGGKEGGGWREREREGGKERGRERRLKAKEEIEHEENHGVGLSLSTDDAQRMTPYSRI